MTLRTSEKHWTHLAVLCASLERAVEWCERLDAYREVRTFRAQADRGSDLQDTRDRVQKYLSRLDRRIDQEIDRVTAAKIIEETRHKMKRAAA